MVFGSSVVKAEEKVAFFQFERLPLEIVFFFVGFFKVVFSFIAGIHLRAGAGTQAFVHVLRYNARQRQNCKNMNEKSFHSV